MELDRLNIGLVHVRGGAVTAMVRALQRRLSFFWTPRFDRWRCGIV